jgi:uncharacterized protein
MANPDRDNKIFVGKGESGNEFLALALASRCGLAVGATDNGKTKTSLGLAEGFSRAGFPVFAAGVKGGLSGIAPHGKARPQFVKRAKDLGFDHAAEFTETAGSRTAGAIGNAIACGALGGVLKR